MRECPLDDLLASEGSKPPCDGAKRLGVWTRRGCGWAAPACIERGWRTCFPSPFPALPTLPLPELETPAHPINPPGRYFREAGMRLSFIVSVLSCLVYKPSHCCEAQHLSVWLAGLWAKRTWFSNINTWLRCSYPRKWGSVRWPISSRTFASFWFFGTCVLDFILLTN